MKKSIERREFMKLATAGGFMVFAMPNFFGIPELLKSSDDFKNSKIVSPGCRGTKVKVARLYMGNPAGLWPEPNLDLAKEIQFYRSRFSEMGNELSDVDFIVDQLVSTPEEVISIKDKLSAVDGILVIHLTLEVSSVLNEILSAGKPTMIFAVPFSGHEWSFFGTLMKEPIGAKMGCILSSDYKQLAFAIRPFRAIHHLREAKILNLTTYDFSDYADSISKKFGTQIKRIELNQLLDAYNSIKEKAAEEETRRWINGAAMVVEPSEAEIYKSCKMALAFEKLMDEEDATAFTVDCYGSMYEPLCKKYAFPCIGFTRLNDMGLGGICESDLQSAMTHILYQGLAGRPGFIAKNG